MTNVTIAYCNERHSSLRWLFGGVVALGTAIGSAFLGMASYSVSCAHDAHQKATAAESEADHNGEALAEIHTDVREIRAAVFRIEKNGE